MRRATFELGLKYVPFLKSGNSNIRSRHDRAGIFSSPVIGRKSSLIASTFSRTS